MKPKCPRCSKPIPPFAAYTVNGLDERGTIHMTCVTGEEWAKARGVKYVPPSPPKPRAACRCAEVPEVDCERHPWVYPDGNGPKSRNEDEEGDEEDES